MEEFGYKTTKTQKLNNFLRKMVSTNALLIYILVSIWITNANITDQFEDLEYSFRHNIGGYEPIPVQITNQYQDPVPVEVR